MLLTTRVYKLKVAEGNYVAVVPKAKAAPHMNALTHIPHSDRHNMLLLQQIGSVRVGEVVRYTFTYIPSQDRVLPTPATLHVKVRNTCAIALRAAYLHGPYTLYAACYPSTFDPNVKPDTINNQGLPQFEANLKAGGAWTAQLTVPEYATRTASKASIHSGIDENAPKYSWIVEISSQVLFSSTATVHFELLVGRDASSVELGSNILPGTVHAPPGEVHNYLKYGKERRDRQHAQAKGVFSKAIELVIEDTASLWDKPHLPDCDRRRTRRLLRRTSIDQAPKVDTNDRPTAPVDAKQPDGESVSRQKKVHLVVVTHGLHSNIGADMLYLKESIDAAAKEARVDRKKRKAALRKKETEQNSKPQAQPVKLVADGGILTPGNGNVPTSDPEAQHDVPSETDDSEEEDVVVRGFSGNVIRTERGLQYLGKRLAKYVLTMTYPDQPLLPTKESVAKKMSKAFSGSGSHDLESQASSHLDSDVRDESKNAPLLPYRISSISFIGHSLGGLTQTYAIAYIQKHSPSFFHCIKPINFIALATPFLGLNHENPIYVKFALDFGLVGKTGQDLGLAWRAPNFARSGWAALIGGTGTEGQRSQKHLDPGSKPLLRLLPTGPAHQVLKMFRNRTVYANVVNDGIVPLRTSCLLFLDWRGLGRVEKARRENGLVGTMASWGWAEMTGINSSQKLHRRDGGGDGASPSDVESGSGVNTPNGARDGETVPQPAQNATADDAVEQGAVQGQEEPSGSQFLTTMAKSLQDEDNDAKSQTKDSPSSFSSHPFSSLFSLLMPNSSNQNHHHPPKHSRIYKRGQTIGHDQINNKQNQEPTHGQAYSTTSHSDTLNESQSNVFTPPKTTVFEAAGDILNPPLPLEEYFVDPTTRPRTIFHDRIYHPGDIPPPPVVKRRSTLLRSLSADLKNSGTRSSTYLRASENVHSSRNERQVEQHDSSGGMKVEEKTARAYHKDLSWRKVLVRLEPDAHNNIIVRRMFSNAYGWPVIKHLVDTHFADTIVAGTDDSDEPSDEHARPVDEAMGTDGEEVKGQEKVSSNQPQEIAWADGVNDPLKPPNSAVLRSRSGRPEIMREETAMTSWDDQYFESGSDERNSESDVSQDERSSAHVGKASQPPKTPKGTDEAEIADFLSTSPQQNALGKGPNIQEYHGSATPTPYTLGLPHALSLGLAKNSSASIGLHASIHHSTDFSGK